MNEVESWSPADGLLLEPNALHAVTNLEGNLLVTAGPGAGKTELLAQRVDFVLRMRASAYPRRVLAIAFKVDASVNLATRVRERSGIELARRLDSRTFHAFARRIVEAYRLVLPTERRPNSGFTVGPRSNWPEIVGYDELIPLATLIVETNEFVRRSLRATYTHVLLDEFQDCTTTQYALLTAAFHGAESSLTAVGDDKQRIMGWAGALDGILQRYAEEFDAPSVQLYQNRRSLPNIRRLQNAMVKQMDSSAAVADNEIVGHEGTVRVVSSATCEDEATEIANVIVETQSNGVSLSEIAILVSKQPQLYAEALTKELDRRLIPYRDEQTLQDLLAEPLFELVCDYVRVLLGDREPIAYTRLLGRLIGPDAQDEDEYRLNLFWTQEIASARAQAEALNAMPLASGEARGRKMAAVVADFLEKAGPDVLQSLAAQYEEDGSLAEAQAKVIAQIETVFGSSSTLLGGLSRLTDEDSVRILTIHKSKGLEFDTVVVMAVEEETFWSQDKDAERAAFFVAVSRARRQLVLTSTEYRRRPALAASRWDSKRTPHQEFLGYAVQVR
ncbi:ATP-dependent helicase [Pseudonocardia alni]|uniref:ATP-dependent helicase n=1 Tax=Pseudonocardia alni TaxID=33907 RepID=UPI0033CDD9E1